MRRGGLQRRGLVPFVAAVLPFAFRVREQDATPLDATTTAPPIAENERIAKRWRLAQSKTAALHRVQLNVPGLTYVTYDAAEANSETLATVRVTGDSSAIVECVDVVQLPPNGVELRWKANECAQVRGHLLTSLSLAREAQVNDIRARGSGTVVIEDGVLVADCEHASVRVAAEGAGNVFVSSQRSDVELRSLHLSIVGAGTLQFVGPERLNVHDPVLLEVGGHGKLRFLAGHVNAQFLRSSIAGSGDIKMSVDRICVDKLKTSIVGCGNVEYDGEGQCRVQRCTVVGSGKVIARDIVSVEGSVEAFGDADVTLNVSDGVHAKGWSTTTVRYVGDKPTVWKGKSVSMKSAPPVSEETKPDLQAATPPRKEAAFKGIHAVYDSELDVSKNVTGLRKAVWYVLNAFSDNNTAAADSKNSVKSSSEPQVI